MSDATKVQPLPTGEGIPIAHLVKQDLIDVVDGSVLVQNDIDARIAEGEKKYGDVLRAHNGRNAVLDAYQECLDMVVYLRQAVEEGHFELSVAYVKVLRLACLLKGFIHD